MQLRQRVGSQLDGVKLKVDQPGEAAQAGFRFGISKGQQHGDVLGKAEKTPRIQGEQIIGFPELMRRPPGHMKPQPGGYAGLQKVMDDGMKAQPTFSSHFQQIPFIGNGYGTVEKRLGIAGKTVDRQEFLQHVTRVDPVDRQQRKNLQQPSGIATMAAIQGSPTLFQQGLDRAAIVEGPEPISGFGFQLGNPRLTQDGDEPLQSRLCEAQVSSGQFDGQRETAQEQNSNAGIRRGIDPRLVNQHGQGIIFRQQFEGDRSHACGLHEPGRGQQPARQRSQPTLSQSWNILDQKPSVLNVIDDEEDVGVAPQPSKELAGLNLGGVSLAGSHPKVKVNGVSGHRLDQRAGIIAWEPEDAIIFVRMAIGVCDRQLGFADSSLTSQRGGACDGHVVITKAPVQSIQIGFAAREIRTDERN